MVEEIGALARNDKINGAIKEMHLAVGEMQQLLVGIWRELVGKKASDHVRQCALQWLGQAIRMNIDKHKSHIDHDRVSSKGLLMVRWWFVAFRLNTAFLTRRCVVFAGVLPPQNVSFVLLQLAPPLKALSSVDPRYLIAHHKLPGAPGAERSKCRLDYSKHARMSASAAEARELQRKWGEDVVESPSAGLVSGTMRSPRKCVRFLKERLDET